MSDFYKLHFWRLAEKSGYLTPCSKGDERAVKCEIECFGPGRDTHNILRQEGEPMPMFLRRVADIEKLMQAAHWQGRRFQAGVMREALEVR
jgi:hypothetical protein